MTTPATLPATFNDFLGNAPAVEQLRTAIAAGRFPHSLILAGPQGAGKYTLALMLAMAVECERQPRDLWSNGQSLASFCGVCRNCTRIASAADLDGLVAQAVTAREDLRDADKKDTRVLIQQHPDVLIVPPDPPQLLIKLGQVRTVIHRANYLPSEGPRKLFILTAANFMKEAANSLLKVLEEPPDYVHILILAENPGELLPTIRSRCALIRLGALPPEELEMLLADRRPQWKPQQRTLVARLAQGAAGRALSFDLDAYTAARADALLLIRNAVEVGGPSFPVSSERVGSSTSARAPSPEPAHTANVGGPSFPVSSERVGSSTSARASAPEPGHTALFKMTETYRSGAEGQIKTTAMLRALSLLLEDLLLLSAGTPELIRNTDLRPELAHLSQSLSFDWIEHAARGMDQVYSGMRRNLLRSLSLDAFATQLATRAPVAP